MTHQPTEARLAAWVSADRLSKYASAPEDTVELYVWNASLSGALFELIGHVEVMLRNVIHAQLAPHSPNGAWYDDPYYPYTKRAKADVAKAKWRAQRGGVALRPGKVVAELSFGFWRYLLTNTYSTTIWPRVSPGLVGVPRHSRSRANLEQLVAQAHDLRNRVAHHEPIFQTDANLHVNGLIEISRHVDSAAPQWIREISRVSELMAVRPS